MGITGLIPFLEKASAKVHLKDLRGCTVAVDTYCWLHKGVFSCADKLCRGEDTDMYVHFCLKYVSMLLSYDIKPILVFDGRHLPAKALTEKRRRESRDQSKKRAAELLRLGRTDEARSHMRRCIDVTHEMALRLIKECRQRNVDCIVAPYEADAQMAFLNKLDIAQYIITEDSDLVLFGSKKIIFKLDLTGAGLLVDSENLHLAMGCRKEKYTFDKFRVMCILSGCDYLDSLPGIGLAKACKFILKTEEDDMRRALKKIPQYLNMRSLQVDEEYIENFLKADATFKHMFVYNPIERRMERLNDLMTWNTSEEYCSNAGEPLDDRTAFQLALGNLNPFSLKVLDTWNPDKNQVFSNVKRTKHKSIWLSDFQPHKVAEKRTKSQDIRYALQFKKITYANLQEEVEEDRPEESDIVSMYKAQGEPPSKRRCSDAENVETSQQVTPTKRAFNPFALVSPRENKSNEPSPRKLAPSNPFKRSIFSTKVEVRSRFFSSNVCLAGNPETNDEQTTSSPEEPPKTYEAVAEEIKRIEEISEQNRDKATMLYDYNSPSPVKSCAVKPVEESPVSSMKALKTDPIPQSIDSGISSPHTTVSEPSNQLSLDVLAFEPNNVIELSDEEVKPRPTKAAQRKTRLKKSRSLGLSKPKKTNSTSKMPANQTRLSMFGFQKRPSLK